MTKPNEWWGIKYPDSWNDKFGIRPFSCRSTRREAIEHYCSEIDVEWKKLCNQGFRCVKVIIKEVK